MLTAPVWIDGAVKSYIGGFVVANHLVAGVDGQGGGRCRRERFLQTASAVVDVLAGIVRIPVRRIQPGPPALVDTMRLLGTHGECHYNCERVFPVLLHPGCLLDCDGRLLMLESL